MGKLLRPSERERRLAICKTMFAQGVSQHDIAARIGLSQPALFSFLKRHGHAIGYKPRLSYTKASRERMGQRTADLMSTDWQVADPKEFAEEMLESVQRICNCSPEHAAWLLSCPRGTNPARRCAIGNRGGSAIG